MRHGNAAVKIKNGSAESCRLSAEFVLRYIACCIENFVNEKEKMGSVLGTSRIPAKKCNRDDA